MVFHAFLVLQEIFMKSDSKLGLFILLIIGLFILTLWILRKTKRLRLPNVVIVTGAPKTGKSALSLSLAHKRYLGNLIKWYIGKPIFKFLCHITRRNKEYPLKPMFYTNVPVGFKHNRITKDILHLEVKVPPKSVFFIDEVSLMADSMMFKNDKLNLDLLLFFKLIGHTTYGGSVFMNSQCVGDVHYSIKRVLGSYLYIHHTTKYPFISVCAVREMVYSDDSQVGNNVTEDLDLTMRRCFFFNRIYKKYDCYCYSTITDKRMYQVNYKYDFDKKNLKAYDIVSFNVRIEPVNQKLHEDFYDEEGNLIAEEDRFNKEIQNENI